MNRDEKVENEHRIFRGGWWLVNQLLFVAPLSTIGTGAGEYSVRKYLSGFSDAVVPGAASSREKVEAILAWMSNGPPRLEANDAKKLSLHDPTDTLNYRQLLEVCGSATNAFLNLSRSARLRDWSPLLERRSFLFFFLSVNALLCLLALRVVLRFLADHHFQVNRFRLRHKLSPAIAAFFSAPEIK